MVLAVSTEADVTRRVADAAIEAWRRTGTTMVEMSLATLTGVAARGLALLAAEDGIVECVVEGDLGPLVTASRRISADGWKVAVLVPSRRMGEAHAVLRGAPVRIQPWWDGADDSVLFGVPEVP